MRCLGVVMLALLSTGIFSAPARAGQPDAGQIDSELTQTSRPLEAQEQPSESAEDRGVLPSHRKLPTFERKLSVSREGADRTWYSNGLAALALVLVSIGILAWLFKRFAPRSKISGGKAIEVISKTYLSSKQSLALVRVGRRAMLIGITPDHINCLATIDEPSEVQEIQKPRDADVGQAAGEFENVLGQASGLFDVTRQDAELVTEPGHPATGSAQRSLQALLKRVRSLAGRTGTY